MVNRAELDRALKLPKKTKQMFIYVNFTKFWNFLIPKESKHKN
jgi:hypothetical protein